MSKKSENLSDLNKKDRNKRHSSPFINVVKGVFFVVRVTLVPCFILGQVEIAHAWERRWMFNLPVPESAVYFYLLATRNYLNCIFSRP